MVDPDGLKEAAAFKRIRLLYFLYFWEGKLLGMGIGMDNLKRLLGKSAIWVHDGHPCEVCSDIKPDREIGGDGQHFFRQLF